MRVSVHHWRRLCSHWNCNNAQMIETVVFTARLPSSSRDRSQPRSLPNVSSVGHSNMGKFSMEKSRQLTNRVAPFAELNSVLGIHGRNIQYALRDFKPDKVPRDECADNLLAIQLVQRTTHYEAQTARHQLEYKVCHTEEKTNYTRQWPGKERPIH